MREQAKARWKLAGTGFLQVVFVAMNTVFIAHYELLANFATGLAISLIWSWNVKRVAFGDTADRWSYALGAAFGSVTGTIIASWIV